MVRNGRVDRNVTHKFHVKKRTLIAVKRDIIVDLVLFSVLNL